MKNSESNKKQNAEAFWIKKDKNTPTDYKPKKKLDAFEGKCVEYMSE